MKAIIIEIERGDKSGKVLRMRLDYLDNAESNLMSDPEARGYERQIYGNHIKYVEVDKKDFKKYDELSKNLEIVYIGRYRQRDIKHYLLETEA